MPDADRFEAVIIANPRSAGGALGRRWPALAEVIREGFGPFAHRFTREPGDATRLAREALRGGAEMVVAFGGDGTIGEVTDGFFDGDAPVAPGAVLGVLPYGTGGDFRRTVGIPRNLKEAARLLRGRRADPVDVGRLSFVGHDGQPRRRHFINIASFGMSGVVDQLVNEASKALGGRISFAWATLRAFRQYRAQRVRLSLDGGRPREVTVQVVAVANGRYFGGGMQVAPDARIDDGRFDVVVMGPQTVGDLLLRGHRIYRGTHLDDPRVQVARAREVLAEPGDPGAEILLDVDGETPGRLPARFELLPGALRLKRP